MIWKIGFWQKHLWNLPIMRNEWITLNQYEQWEKTCSGVIKNYARNFKVELVEIIMQINSGLPLSGYKIQSSISKSAKRWIIFKRIFKPLFQKPLKIVNKIETKSELIFIVEHVGHYKQLKPIANLLKSRATKFQVIFIQLELFHKYKNEFENVSLLSTEINILSWLHTIQLITLIWFNKSFYTLVNHKKKSELKLEVTLLNAKLLNTINTQKNNLAKILDKIPNANVVFFKAEGCRTKSLINLCNIKERKSYAIQHGLIRKELKYTDLFVGVYITWSDYFTECLLDSKAKCKTIALGCSNYDLYFKQRDEKDTLPPSLNLGKILFLPNSGNSQTPQSEIEFATNLCVEFFKNNRNLTLTIKPHPGDKSSLIKDIVKKHKFENKVKILPNDSSIPYSECDIIITMNSTTGIESSIFRKPIIIILSDPKYIMVEEYLTYGIAKWANSLSILESTIVDIYKNYDKSKENSDFFIKKMIKNPGTAAQEICNYLTATKI